MALKFLAKNESDTDRFAAALAGVLPAGVVVALSGTLGAGKTRLVQAVAKAAGVDPSQVVSPTFVLVHEYHTAARHPNPPDHQPRVQQTPLPQPPPIIYHLDAYRIRDDDEFLQLGPEEFFQSNGWTFIEWADRVADCLPKDYMRIEIAVRGHNERQITTESVGPRYKETVAALSHALQLSG
jgi:tRNA threonylcarbamoyladenosine biosynthesis protein TsaE